MSCHGQAKRSRGTSREWVNEMLSDNEHKEMGYDKLNPSKGRGSPSKRCLV
jgi:hypothetical protein